MHEYFSPCIGFARFQCYRELRHHIFILQTVKSGFGVFILMLRIIRIQLNAIEIYNKFKF